MKPAPAVAALLALSAFAAPAALHAGGSCCAAPVVAASETKTEAAAGHPLRGVIVAVLPEKSALLVRHEEIPGVMAAMTMLLKVDAAALATAQKDQAITATLVKKADGWWLENIAPVAPAPATTP